MGVGRAFCPPLVTVRDIPWLLYFFFLMTILASSFDYSLPESSNITSMTAWVSKMASFVTLNEVP